MKQLLTLPTWILVRTLIPFLPKKHDWKNKRFSLKNWSEHSTKLNNTFSIMFWLNGLILIFLFFILF